MGTDAGESVRIGQFVLAVLLAAEAGTDTEGTVIRYNEAQGTLY